MTGRHMKAARILAGMTQAELAEIAGIHANSVKRLEAEKDRIAVGWFTGYSTAKVMTALESRGISISDERDAHGPCVVLVEQPVR